MTNRNILVHTEDHFDTLVEAVDFTGVSHLVLFTAPWCIPCRQFQPHWIKAQELLPNHMFIKVEMGETPEDTGAHWATVRYGIRGVPAVKLFTAQTQLNSPAIIRDIKVPQGVIAFVREVNLG